MPNLEKTMVEAWQNQSAWLWLLLPLSWLYFVITTFRRWLYHQGILSSFTASVPVLVVGNITVGGSGKTPLLIALVTFLQRQGIRVGVISRGYGRSETQPMMVTLESTPEQVGDEPCLIVQSTQVPMAVCANRQKAIELLLQHDANCQIILSDDGLQHYRLNRQLEWVVVDEHRGFGNGQLLPVGFLREPIRRLNGTTVIYHLPYQTDTCLASKVADDTQRLSMRLVADELYPLLGEDYAHSITPPMPPMVGETVYAISGIGYPKRFFDTLAQLGFQVIECPFPDHHQFELKDFEPFNEFAIIMTSKDAIKVRQLAKRVHHLPENFAKMWVLPVNAQLSEATYDVLVKQLANLNISTPSVSH